MIEWIEKMKTGNRKATASMTLENMALLEEVAAKHECKNISELIVHLCKQSSQNNDEELISLREQVEKLNASELDLSNTLLREEKAAMTFRTQLEEEVERFKLIEEENSKIKTESGETMRLLQLAQEKIDQDTATITTFKEWLASERNRISSWWHKAPPLN